ncbi:MAG: Rab family GTPase [Candidatus Thorarchaeota archaeon]
MLKYKIILAGDKNVGKTSLIARFCDNIFKEDMKATIGVDFKRKVIDLKGEHKAFSLDLNIWDFAGEEKYRALFPSYANGAAGAMILFDTTNKKSLYDIENWIKIVDENAQENVVKILIATKIDLKEERQVSKNDAKEYCKKYEWCTDFISTSAKTGENVESAFIQVAEQIIKNNLQLCKSCGEMFNKKLKNCQHCGEKVEIEIPPL